MPCFWRKFSSMIGLKASEILRDVAMSGASPARSMPSKIASSEPTDVNTPWAKSSAPVRISRMISGPRRPLEKRPLKSTVIAPPDFSGMVWVQNGFSIMR